MFPTVMIIYRRLSAARPAGLSPSYRLLTRAIHGSRLVHQQRAPPNPASHGAENYFVDGDETLPQTGSIFKVDATSDAAEGAYEPPTGPWSRAGAGTEEYRTVSKDEPYDVPGDPDAKVRYGGMKRNVEDKGPETSMENLRDTERWSRKPEGRT